VATKRKTGKKTSSKVATRRPRPTAIQRLERGEGEQRVFWEITQFGDRLVLRSGKWLAPGRTSEKLFDDKAAASVAFEKAIADKRADGFSEPAPKEVIGASSRHGVSARNPELEALIAEDPADLSRYLIYADWLQQQGDPRGELITVHHKLATAPERELDALEHIEWKLMRDFGKELLGPLSRHTLIRSGANSIRALAWRCGFVRAARWQSRDVMHANSLRTFLDHPATQFLELLVTDSWNAMNVCQELRERAPATFKTLSIATGWDGRAPLQVIAEGLPTLKSLWVVGAVDVVRSSAITRFEHLKDLEIGFLPPDGLDRLITGNVTFPALENVHLTLAGFDEIEGQDMTRVMTGMMKLFPTVKKMRLRRWNVGAGQDELAAAILAAAREVPNSLIELNLDLTLTRDPPELLPLLTALPRSLTVNIPAAALGNAYLRGEITNKLGKSVRFVPGEPVERDREDVQPLHHERATG